MLFEFLTALCLGGFSPAPGKKVVSVGLEEVELSGGRPLSGRRVGLVANAASVTLDGHHVLEVLTRRGVRVVRLFAPEHGFAGTAAAGEKIPAGIDPESHLPIVSLYGEKGPGLSERIRDLDALVFDLQDAGVRFYTFIGTLTICLEAAAQTGVELVVLDRPNPLGGERVEGPVSDPSAALSLVNRAPGPLVHGLTVGEMARLANSRLKQKANLTVVPMKGWKRSMIWEDTGRAWVAPSPNLRTAEAALVYPGTCLLEATNVSEGRGTDAPFLLFGAPWLNAEPRGSFPGVFFEAVRFRPEGSKAAPDPKYKDVDCQGFRVHVKAPRSVAPYAMGVALLSALQGQAEFRWRRDKALDSLLGTPRVREALERSVPTEEILRADEAGVRAFRIEREKFLLY